MFQRTCLGIAVLGALGIQTNAQILFVLGSNGTVGEYDATTGAAINPELISGLSSPTAIAVTGSNIFVGCQGTAPAIGYVSEYTLSGALVNSQRLTFNIPVTTMTASGTNLFVGTGYYFGPAQIGEYTADGDVVNSTLSGDLTYGMEVSGSDLFISFYGTASNGGVTEYSIITGTPVGSIIAEHLAEPRALAASGSDVFVVSNNGSTPGGINEYAVSGDGESISRVSDGPNAMVTWGDDLFTAGGTVKEYDTSLQLLNADFIPGLDNAEGIAVVLPEPEGFCVFWMFVLLGAARRRKGDRTETYAVLRD